MTITLMQLRKVVFYALIIAVTVCFVRIFVLMSHAGYFKNVDEVVPLWRANPIVSIHIPPHHHRCPRDFETVYMDHTLRGTESYVQDIRSNFWRMSTVCIKRSGRATITQETYFNGRKWFLDRQMPDTHGKCHDGFKKCGDGFNQQEGAICFPFDEECPITNMLVLPSNQSAPANSFWELAGTFAFNNHTLYVRRQYINELPVVDIVFQLTQFDSRGKNVRGVCYNGPNQMLGVSTTSDSPEGYAYNIVYPPTCNITDTRYTLVDQVPLQTHFIHNLQLADPTNTRVVDDCAIGCLGSVYVVHATFRANDKVLSHSNATLGMYFVREALWGDACGVPRVTLYQCKDLAHASSKVLMLAIMLWCAYNISIILSEVADERYLLDFVPFAVIFGFVVWHWSLINQVSVLYDAVGRTDCTDPFTRDTLQQFLQPVKPILHTVYVLLSILAVLIVESSVWFAMPILYNRLEKMIRADGSAYNKLLQVLGIPVTPAEPIVPLQPAVPNVSLNIPDNLVAAAAVIATNGANPIQQSHLTTTTGLQHRGSRRPGR